MSRTLHASATSLLHHLLGDDDEEQDGSDEYENDEEFYQSNEEEDREQEEDFDDDQEDDEPHLEGQDRLEESRVDLLVNPLASSSSSAQKHHQRPLKQFLKQQKKNKDHSPQVIPMTDPKEIEQFYEQLKIIKKHHENEDNDGHQCSLHHLSLQSPLSQTATSNKCSISLFNEHANTLKVYKHSISKRYDQIRERALNEHPIQVRVKDHLKKICPDYKQLKYQVDRVEMKQLNVSKLLGYATCYIPKLHSIFIHGGTNQSNNAQCRDVFVYNIHQNSFHVLEFLNRNLERYYYYSRQGMTKHFMVPVAQSDCILVFGGGAVSVLTFKKVLSLSSQRNSSGNSGGMNSVSGSNNTINAFHEVIRHLKWGVKHYDPYSQKFTYYQTSIPFLNHELFNFSEYYNFQHVLDPSTLTLYLFGGKFQRSNHREVDESHLIFKIEIISQNNPLVIGHNHFSVAFQLSVLIPSHKFQSYSSKITSNQTSFRSNSLICMKCSGDDDNDRSSLLTGTIPVTSITIASLLSHRKHMSTCFVPTTHEIYFYGGIEQNQWRNEMYYFNTHSNRWSMIDMNYSYLDIESLISSTTTTSLNAMTTMVNQKIPQLTPNPKRVIPTMTLNYDSKSMLLFDRIDGSIYCYSLSQSSSGRQSAWNVIHPLGIQSHADYMNVNRILPTQNIVAPPYQTIPQSYYQVLRVGEKLYILNTTTNISESNASGDMGSNMSGSYSCKHFFPIQILTNPIVNTNDTNILSHISLIYRSQEYADVKFVVKKYKKNNANIAENNGHDEYEYFTGHKSIISCRCPYLKELIQQSDYYEEENDSSKRGYYNQSSNTRMLIVKIHDTTSDLFKAILDFIYLGELHLHEDDTTTQHDAVSVDIGKENEQFTIVNRFLSICKKWNFKSEFFESLCRFDQSLHLDVYTKIISDFERDIVSMVNNHEAFADVKIILEDEDYIEGEEMQFTENSKDSHTFSHQQADVVTQNDTEEGTMEGIESDHNLLLPPHSCHYEMVQVHKCMIIRLPFFAKMFEHGFSESLTNTIRFKSNVLDKNALIQVLHYIYTDRSTEITPANCIGILVYSQMFGLSQLASNCRNMIRANLTPHNCSAILEIAQMYKDQALEREVIEYISKNTEASELVLQADSCLSTESKLAIKKKKK
ncbi:hypothetical protein FDP41_004942 [Naegleria fowleri]|uniref:BTB domain-containing protein n=1 Tax=Naegleria fowleri TaxID=5763 RepID=A0A6A5BH88_NAEFO|nr:uncharacterized protein FDP41_004942 [Naegleria fowleri]KAF0976267.1 hypothetical protein FDP41_004942 [Naegleria fowleri]CAG4716452.1 unnamed protein product [Naegleria fowleri]